MYRTYILHKLFCHSFVSKNKQFVGENNLSIGITKIKKMEVKKTP